MDAPIRLEEGRNTPDQFLQHDQFLIGVVEHWCENNPFFRCVNEAWGLVMLGGHGFGDVRSFLDLQMGSSITGANVGFLGVALQVGTGSPDGDHGGGRSQHTLSPCEAREDRTEAELESRDFVWFRTCCRCQDDPAVLVQQKGILADDKDGRSIRACTQGGVIGNFQLPGGGQLFGGDPLTVDENFACNLSHAAAQGDRTTAAQKKTDCSHRAQRGEQGQHLPSIATIPV